jgi:hypothetical protein
MAQKFLPLCKKRTMTKRRYTGGDPKHEPNEHKGQPVQNEQKGSPENSKRDTGRHQKDESDGAERNTTKKQQNSI